MQYWWVNHKQTYKEETQGGYIWSPKSRKNGVASVYYDNLTRTVPGDVVFSYADTSIKAIGTVTHSSTDAGKPSEFGNKGDHWDNSGWLVLIQWTFMEIPIIPKQHIHAIAPLLPAKYSPLQQNGTGNQGCYLASISKDLATFLVSIASEGNPYVNESLIETQETITDSEQESIIYTKHIPETQKEQLIKARRGQGIFRQRLQGIEKACRVTGVTDTRVLIASHIKPWRESNDSEKLDGQNGLFLSPHIDKLFDKGLISFSDDGILIYSKGDVERILSQWGIDCTKGVGTFTPKQKSYLAYHREHVYKRNHLHL